jgi:membrane associated rhomboid family serine protease
MSNSSTTTTTTRSAELVRSLPVATAATIGLCCSVFVSQIVLDANIHLFTMCPRLVLYLHEYYRIVTSCFFHGSLLHIGMNMMSTAGISTLVERRLGTLAYCATVFWSVLLTGILYLSIAVTAYVVLGYDDLMYSHALGFSGIMFHLLVLESNMTPNAQRSVFGFANVPSQVYPMVMLIVMQFIMPNISFVGHLCGIIAGTLHLYGLLDWFLLKESFLQEMEQWRILRFVTTKENFVPTPTSNLSSSDPLRRDPRTLLVALRQGCQFFFTFLGNVLETIHVAIFGRGRRANANLHLGGGRSWNNPWASNERNTEEGPEDYDEENLHGHPRQQSELL